MTSLNSLPADVIHAVISFVGRNSAIDGNFTIDSSLWVVARGWDEHVAEALDWSYVTISRRDYGAAGHVVDVLENDEMRYLASRRLDMGAARAAALPRAIREKVRRATFVFDASGRFEALGAAPFPNLERAELAATHARERPAPFHCRREPMGDAFYADVLPLLRGVAAIRDMKCYVTDTFGCGDGEPAPPLLPGPGRGARDAARDALAGLKAIVCQTDDGVCFALGAARPLFDVFEARARGPRRGRSGPARTSGRARSSTRSTSTWRRPSTSATRSAATTTRAAATSPCPRRRAAC